MQAGVGDDDITTTNARHLSVRGSTSYSFSPPDHPPGPSRAPRAARACTTCSRLKLKCDGTTPCSRCVSLDAPGECAYVPSMRGKMRRKRQVGEGDLADGLKGEKSKVRKVVNNGDKESSGAKHHSYQKTTNGGRDERPEEGYFGLQLDDSPSDNYLQWEKGRLMPTHGPRNSSLWKNDDVTDNHGATSPISPSTLHPLPNALAPRSEHDNYLGSKHRGSEHRPSSSTPILSDPSTSHSYTRTSIQSPHIEVADNLTTLPLPGDRNPLAVLAEASESTTAIQRVTEVGSSEASAMAQGKLGAGEQGLDGYYAPLARTLKDEAPHIMNLINVHEAETLFDVYFAYLHPHLPLLDVAHSSPAAVARRNNFLFNAICCASARAFNVVLWGRLANFARFEGERLPKEKNIDVIQGHLIYATWVLHRPQHFEQDMSWLRAGLAVRTAKDVNLHRVALVKQAREGLPRWVVRAIARTWLGTYIVDGTLSAQLGKSSTMRGERSIQLYIDLLRNPSSYWTASPLSGTDDQDGRYSSPDDLWIAALAEWNQILSRAIETFRSETQANTYDRLDKAGYECPGSGSGAFPDLPRVFDRQFRDWRKRAENAIQTSYASQGIFTNSRSTHVGGNNDKIDSPKAGNGERRSSRSAKLGTSCLSFRLSNLLLYEQYARVILCSFGLEGAVECSKIDVPAAMSELQSAAARMIDTFQICFDANNSVRLGVPDSLYTFLTFATVSLLRVLQNQFAYLEPNHVQIIGVARRAADILAQAAVTPDDIPAGYSVFLSKLIDVKATQLIAGRSERRNEASGSRGATAENAKTSGRGLDTGNDTSRNALSHSQEVTAIDPILSEWLPKAMDFEAFGQSLDEDQGRSVWPPMPNSLNANTAHQSANASGTVNISRSSYVRSTDEWYDNRTNTALNPSLDDLLSGHLNTSTDPASNVEEGMSGSLPHGNEMRTHSVPLNDAVPTDLRSWVASTPTRFPGGLGMGMGLGLGMNHGTGDDFVGGQDSFWRSILEGVNPAPGMV